MSPFSRVCTTSYLTFRNYSSILYCFRVIAGYLSKVADSNLPHLHLASPLGVTPLNFEEISGMDLNKSDVIYRTLSFLVSVSLSKSCVYKVNLTSQP